MVDAARKHDKNAGLRLGATVRPDTDTCTRLADTAMAAGRFHDAIPWLRLAVRQQPGDALALCRLGAALYKAQRPDEALVALRSAVALAPGALASRLGLGTLLCALEDYASAIMHLNAAVMCDPGSIPAWYNLGVAMLGQGDCDGAIHVFTHALTLAPDHAAVRFHRALAWLSAGNFTLGLLEYEWRLHVTAHRGATLAPRWDGSALGARKLLIHAEQGLGDTLHFLRFVSLARALAPNIVFQVQSALYPLLQPLVDAWGIAVVDESVNVADAAVSCPLMSLPLALGAGMTAPAPMPCLSVPADSRAKWRGLLRHLRGRKIGIAWSGNRRPYDNRAMDAAMLDSLFSMEGIDWVVLQKDVSAADRQYLETCPHASRIHVCRDQIDTMADTAALIEQLDAVVSIDTSVAHLAGAMQCPVWIMLPFAADWRWRIDAKASRWYPTARLVRQSAPGDWAGVIMRLSVQCAQWSRHI